MLTVLGALGLMVSLVMPWYGERAPLDPSGSDFEVYTAFQAFGAADIALLLMALVVIVAVVAVPTLGRWRVPSAPAESTAEVGIYAYAGVIAVGLVAVALVLVKLAGPLPEDDFVLRYGARFAVVCAATVTIGAFVGLCLSIDYVLGALQSRP